MKKKKPNEDNYYYYEKNVKNKIADDEDIEQISCCFSFFLWSSRSITRLVDFRF